MANWLLYTLGLYFVPVLLQGLRRLYYGDLRYMNTQYSIRVPTGSGTLVVAGLVGLGISLIESVKAGFISWGSIDIDIFIQAGETELGMAMSPEMIIALVTLTHLLMVGGMINAHIKS